MKAFKITIAIVVAVALLFVALLATDSGDRLVIESETIVSSLSGDRVATGVVRNVTDDPQSQFEVVADFLDYEGNVVDTATTTLGAVPPQGSLKFEFPVEREEATSVRARVVEGTKNP